MDIAVRAIDSSESIRAFAVSTTGLAREAAEIHKCSATAAAALVRVLTAACIMGMTLKGEKDLLTIQVKGGGPIGKIVAVANSRGEVKGYADFPQADLPLNPLGKLDVGGLVGRNGYLLVAKDLGLKEPYIGQVKLVSGEIGDDITAYYSYSEQTPTATALGVLVDKDLTVLAAGGYMIQLMPDADHETTERLENRLKDVEAVSSLINRGYSPARILEYVLEDKDIRILEERPVKLACDCSRERLERVLISLGEEEVRSILEQQGKVEITCHFCNQRYVFMAEELKKMINQ